jgi:hypothetical protein
MKMDVFGVVTVCSLGEVSPTFRRCLLPRSARKLLAVSASEALMNCRTSRSNNAMLLT